MTLEEIYDRYRRGSDGMVIAIETHTGYELSRTEIWRLAVASKDAEEFDFIHNNETYWTDENNQVEL